jgi:hypothetical protein
MLLSRGAKPYDVDKNDKTCIFWAAEEDHLEALKVRVFTMRITLYDISNFSHCILGI